MISKILITLAVIMICMWMISSRAKPELRKIPNPVDERRKKHLRNGAIAFMMVICVTAQLHS